MVTVVTKDIYITENGQEFTELEAAELQEMTDLVAAAIDEDITGDDTITDVIQMILCKFTVTPIPQPDQGEDDAQAA